MSVLHICSIQAFSRLNDVTSLERAICFPQFTNSMLISSQKHPPRPQRNPVKTRFPEPDQMTYIQYHKDDILNIAHHLMVDWYKTYENALPVHLYIEMVITNMSHAS